MRRRPTRPRSRAAAVLLLALAAVVGSALPASAHALLESSDPVAGSMVATAPARVDLAYSESVTVDRNSVQVLDAAGKRVDRADTHHGAAGSEVIADLTGGLGKGTYVVSWRAISADSHPVAGAFTFGVGVVPDPTAASRLGHRAGSVVVGWLDGAARLASETGIALAAGGAFFLLLLWRDGLARVGPRRVVWIGWGLAAAGALALFLLEGPYGSGYGLTAVARDSVLSQTFGTRYGKLELLRLVLLAVALPILRSLASYGPDPAGRPRPLGGLERLTLSELGLIGVGVAATLAAGGHEGTGTWAWLATTSLTLHVLAMAAWIGGLVMLVAFPLREARDDAALRGLLPRWSVVAIVSVAVVVVTGTYQGWREVRSFAALFGTTYGKLLILKVILVLAMLGLGAVANRVVARRYRTVAPAAGKAVASEPAAQVVGANRAGPGGAGWGGRGGSESEGPDRAAGGSGADGPAGPGVVGLRRGVAAETVFATAVLVVTALLVNAPPARSSYAPPVTRTVATGPLKARVDIRPTRQGAERILVDVLDSAGRPRAVEDVAGALSLRARDVGPLDVRFALANAGQAVANSVPVPFTGTWTLTVTIRVDDFDQYSATVTYQVR